MRAADLATAMSTIASAQKTTHFPKSGLAAPVTYETTKLSHTTVVTRETMPTRSSTVVCSGRSASRS